MGCEYNNGPSIESSEEVRLGRKVTWVGFWTNAGLSVLKILAGVFGRSAAMIADGVHSASDLLTDVAVLIVIGVSRKKADSSHSYGHGKIETFVTFLIALLLGAVGIGILVDGVERGLAFFKGEEILKPTWIALSMALVSILVKEWLFRYTRSTARKIASTAMEANAWHHRSDAFSSMATLAGVAGAMFLGPGWRFLDPLAAVVVSALIIAMACSMAKSSVKELLEASLPNEESDRIRKIIETTPGVKDFHHLRSRSNGNTKIIDFHIKLDPDIPLRTAHDIATKVENRIKEEFSPSVVNIHMEPYHKHSNSAGSDHR
ncbi:MAG: cation diffusion facilitator family transporter [Muribaculaceae bacterium]|nr:cation diffusion facilitator family transporter [Muribaculaceae bacterium]